MTLDEFLITWQCPQGCNAASAIDRGDVIVVEVCRCFWHLWPRVVGSATITADKQVRLETRQ